MNEDAWYIIELKGYRRRAGQMREVEWAGAKWVRIDMPVPESCDQTWDMEHFHPSAIYSFRQVSEDAARAEASALWGGLI